MRPLTLLLGSVALCLGCTSSPSVGRDSAAIVGGAVDVDTVAVLDILVDGEQSCTGTLISPHVVLTAAHCVVEDVDGEFTELEIFTGPDESDLAGGEVLAVVGGAVNPIYGTDDEVGDIAVLALGEPLAIAPIPWNTNAITDAHVGTPTRVVGYGETAAAEGTTPGGQRKTLTAPLNAYDENWLLVGGVDGESQCYGDSGGPVLMVWGGVEHVAGINSWGETDDCGDEEYNTRVDAFADFVAEQVAIYDPGFEPGGDGDGDDGDGDGGGDDGDGGGDDGDGGGDDGDDGDGDDGDGGDGDDGAGGDDGAPADGAGGGCSAAGAPITTSPWLPLAVLLGFFLTFGSRRR